MTSASAAYPIGTPGTPWGDAERTEWLSRQTRQRSYRKLGQIYFLDLFFEIENRIGIRVETRKPGRLASEK